MYTVYVGSGAIKDRLSEHANDSIITQHEGNEPLRAFWVSSGRLKCNVKVSNDTWLIGKIQR